MPVCPAKTRRCNGKPGPMQCENTNCGLPLLAPGVPYCRGHWALSQAIHQNRLPESDSNLVADYNYDDAFLYKDIQENLLKIEALYALLNTKFKNQEASLRNERDLLQKQLITLQGILDKINRRMNLLKEEMSKMSNRSEKDKLRNQLTELKKKREYETKNLEAVQEDLASKNAELDSCLSNSRDTIAKRMLLLLQTAKENKRKYDEATSSEKTELEEEEKKHDEPQETFEEKERKLLEEEEEDAELLEAVKDVKMQDNNPEVSIHARPPRVKVSRGREEKSDFTPNKLLRRPESPEEVAERANEATIAQQSKAAQKTSGKAKKKSRARTEREKKPFSR